jgi:hypothetical protein
MIVKRDESQIIKERLNQLRIPMPGADPGFQVRGRVQLKTLHRAKGGAKMLGVFRVKNHDFTPKNHIFSNWILPLFGFHLF